MKRYGLVGGYSEKNPFKVGDRIKLKRNNEIMTVGDDWDELYHWTSDDENNIVTTNGRVLSVSECELVQMFANVKK